jgi:hypothetical protein
MKSEKYYVIYHNRPHDFVYVRSDAAKIRDDDLTIMTIDPLWSNYFDCAKSFNSYDEALKCANKLYHKSQFRSGYDYMDDIHILTEEELVAYAI